MSDTYAEPEPIGSDEITPLRIGYADPPYPGMAHLYKDHPDYGGEVDHAELVARLEAEYDGWCLHTASTTLGIVLPHCPPEPRVLAWVKSFAAQKKGVPVMYAWEPVIVKAARKPVVTARMTYRDWISEPMTMRRGFIGAKPEAVCWWLFEVMGCNPADDLHDMFPGSGAVGRAWESWCTAVTSEIFAPEYEQAVFV